MTENLEALYKMSLSHIKCKYFGCHDMFTHIRTFMPNRGYVHSKQKMSAYMVCWKTASKAVPERLITAKQ